VATQSGGPVGTGGRSDRTTAASGVFAPGRRLLTSGLVLIVTLVAFESLAIATIMPLVEDDLGSLALYGWVFSAFFLGSLIGVVVAGTAADRMRPAVPFAIGLVLFSIGLIMGGLAPTMLVLVLGRLLQGLGAGALPATSYVCIGRSYRPDQRPRMFALISTAWVLPSVIGPTVAGIIGQAVGWRWVFLALLPLCAVIGAIALLGVRAVPAPDEPTTESNVGNAIYVAFGAGVVIAGLGVHSILLAVPLVAVGMVILVSGFRRLTPPGTLRAAPGAPATVLVRGILNFAFFAVDAYVPFALTSVRGLSPIVAGLALTCASFTWTAASWIQARWLDRVGARRLVAAGLGLIAIGTLGMILVLVPAIPAIIGIAVWGIAGFGIGLAYAPLSVVILDEAATGEEGRATMALQLSDMLGVALGSGVAGVLVATATSTSGSETTGLVLTFLMGGAFATLAMVLASRVPGRREVA
jgi:MFS family permease